MTEYFIYKIYCKDETITDIYIGSTKDIQKRWIHHKSNCNNENDKEYNCYKYQFIRDNGGIANWDIIKIERLVCDKDEAFIRERYWIETLQTSLNKIIPTRTDKEYYEQNREKLREINKEYRENNKEKISEIKKEYRENNKEKISEKKKEYYEQNKDKINEKRNEKFTCECGVCYTLRNKSRHFKSKLHQSFVLSLENT